jgi:hypothetical protein
VREALAGNFFVGAREGVAKLGREGSGFGARSLEGTGVAGCVVDVVECLVSVVEWKGAPCIDCETGVPASGGSEEGGSVPMPGLTGVRNGDLNGFWSVLVASFSRRRLTFGVDMFAGRVALGASTLVYVIAWGLK